MGWTDLSEFINVVLGLVAVFQWWDRRSRNKAIENFVEATAQIAQRLQRTRVNDKLTTQAAADIKGNLQSILRSLYGFWSQSRK